MKTFVVLLCCFISIVSVGLGPATLATLAQNQSTAPQATPLSPAAEIVDSLNKTSFPKAHVALDFKGAEDHLDGSDSWESMSLSVSRLSEQVDFSPGFTVASLKGCRLTLKNDQVQILSWGTSSYDRQYMSLARFLFDGKKGEKKLTPQTGVLYIPLDQLNSKGKTPYRYTKNPDLMKKNGTWRTEFTKKGFFRESIFEMEITAAEGNDQKSSMTAQKLLFTFDDKTESENFNVAFRRAIQLCTK